MLGWEEWHALLLNPACAYVAEQVLMAEHVSLTCWRQQEPWARRWLEALLELLPVGGGGVPPTTSPGAEHFLAGLQRWVAHCC